MNEILLNLVVFAGIALVAGIVLLLVTRKQKQVEQQLQQFVQQKGWRFETIRERLVKGFRITSAEWTLEATSRFSDTDAEASSSNMEQKTTWTSAQSGTTILIGPRTTQVNLGAMGKMLQTQVIHAALGKEAAGVQEVQAGSPSFRERYMVWAQGVEDADRLLTPGVQSKLLSWTKVSPLIKRTSSGMTIELKGMHLEKIEEILKLVQLGESLL
ncbi:MAG: hypothetical protein LLG42_02215 [Chloroflexi bacterium]|nr:hypothetical protein [Chloroflexota bacterium]